MEPLELDLITGSETKIDDQKCKVCGEPAAGFHFGAFTCEGCKSFFGRSYKDRGSLECKQSTRACVINKQNRTTCKYCRLEKCFKVGMAKDNSRFGRRSNWFKINCILEQKAPEIMRHVLGTMKLDSEKDDVLADIYRKKFQESDLSDVRQRVGQTVKDEFSRYNDYDNNKVLYANHPSQDLPRRSPGDRLSPAVMERCPQWSDKGTGDSVSYHPPPTNGSPVPPRVHHSPPYTLTPPAGSPSRYLSSSPASVMSHNERKAVSPRYQLPYSRYYPYGPPQQLIKPSAEQDREERTVSNRDSPVYSTSPMFPDRCYPLEQGLRTFAHKDQHYDPTFYHNLAPLNGHAYEWKVPHSVDYRDSAVYSKVSPVFSLPPGQLSPRSVQRMSSRVSPQRNNILRMALEDSGQLRYPPKPLSPEPEVMPLDLTTK